MQHQNKLIFYTLSHPILGPNLTRENQHFHVQSKNQKELRFGTPTDKQIKPQ